MYDSKWIKVLEGAGGHRVRHRLWPSLVGRDSLDLDLVIDQPLYPHERNASYRFILDQYLWPRAERYTLP